MSELEPEKGGRKGDGRNRGGRPRAGQELLSRERILGAALRVVDEGGMGALSMRRLGAELSVNPMSIYHHLSGKDADLDLSWAAAQGLGLTEVGTATVDAAVVETQTTSST